MSDLDKYNANGKRAKAHFIVTLNWVDGLTLIGFVISGLAIYCAVLGNTSLALGLLFLAVLADAFDGVLARKYGIERDFGRYLDSFVDCSIYLALPCVIFFKLGYSEWYYLLILLVFVCCGIIRLSVFNEIGNITASQGLSYLGLPVFWSAFVVAIYYFLGMGLPAVLLEPILSLVLLAYSYLMLTNAPFFKPKNKLLMLVVTLGLSGYFLLLSIQ